MDSALHDYFFEKIRDTNLLSAGDESVRTVSPTPSAESGTGADSLSDTFHSAFSSHGENDRWYVGYLNMLRYVFVAEVQ